MTLTYFCPACWNRVSGADLTCPCCGYDLKSFQDLPYERKLIMALRHPIRDVRVTAISIIAKKNLFAALSELEALIEREENPMVLIEIVDALATIDHPEALDLLRKLAGHRYPLVQKRAQDCLEGKKGKPIC